VSDGVGTLAQVSQVFPASLLGSQGRCHESHVDATEEGVAGQDRDRDGTGFLGRFAIAVAIAFLADVLEKLLETSQPQNQLVAADREMPVTAANSATVAPLWVFRARSTVKVRRAERIETTAAY
jgi:hypothetical protein